MTSETNTRPDAEAGKRKRAKARLDLSDWPAIEGDYDSADEREGWLSRYVSLLSGPDAMQNVIVVQQHAEWLERQSNEAKRETEALDRRANIALWLRIAHYEMDFGSKARSLRMLVRRFMLRGEIQDGPQTIREIVVSTGPNPHTRNREWILQTIREVYDSTGDGGQNATLEVVRELYKEQFGITIGESTLKTYYWPYAFD